jgi:hypothetical protein
VSIEKFVFYVCTSSLHPHVICMRELVYCKFLWILHLRPKSNRVNVLFDFKATSMASASLTSARLVKDCVVASFTFSFVLLMRISPILLPKGDYLQASMFSIAG